MAKKIPAQMVDLIVLADYSNATEAFRKEDVIQVEDFRARYLLADSPGSFCTPVEAELCVELGIGISDLRDAQNLAVDEDDLGRRLSALARQRKAQRKAADEKVDDEKTEKPEKPAGADGSPEGTTDLQQGPPHSADVKPDKVTKK